MKRIFSTLALSTILLLSADAFSQSKKKEKLPLESETYVVEVTPVSTDNKAPSKGKPDEISFKSGKFKSNFFDEKGNFKPCSYTVIKDSLDADEDRYIEFESIAKNENDEELEIKGTVVGYNIEGEVKWSKGGKLKKEYTFAGGIKKK